MVRRLLAGVWPKCLLILLTFLLASWLAFNKGLDLTDTGYHLTNQMRAAALGWSYMGFLPVYWLSDVLAGTLLQTFTLIQLHLVVIAMAAVQLGLLVYLFARQSMPLGWPLTVVMALLGSFMLVPIGFLLLIPDYYAIPTLILYPTMLALVALLTRPGRWPLLAMLALTVLLLNLRFTTGLLVATLPAVITFIQALAFKHRPRQPSRWLVAYYMLLVVVMAAEAAYVTHFYPSVWAEISAAEWKNPKVHSLASLLHSYVAETLHQLLALWPLLLTTLVFATARRLTHNPLLSWHKLPYFLLGAWLGATLAQGFTQGFGNAVTVPSLVITSYILGVVLIMFQWLTNRPALSPQAAFILAGMALPIALFAGSNTGIVKLGYGFPLLAAAVLVLTHTLPLRTRQHALPALFAFYILSLACVVHTSLHQAYENVRITPTAAMTYTLQNGKLRGIQTLPTTGKSVDATIAQILQLTTSTDTIFTFPTIPLFHYATARQNVIGNIPNFDTLQPLHAIATKIGRLCLSPEYTPKLLVLSNHYVFHPLWNSNPQYVDALPPTNDWGMQEATIAIFHIVQANCRPSIIYQNEYFTLLAPHPSYELRPR